MPDAVAVGPFVVPVLRVGAVLALVLGAWAASATARRWQLDAARVARTAEWSIYAYLAGARAGFVAVNASAFADAPWTALYLWQPGYLPAAGGIAALMVMGVRLAYSNPGLRRLDAGALATGAMVAVVAYAGVAGSVRLDLGPGSIRVGDPVPDVSLRDLEGREVGFTGLQGRVVVVNFWATWCPPCRREMPAFDAVHGGYGQDVAVVGVAVGESRAVVERFLAETPVGYPIWLDAPRGSSTDRTDELLRRFGGVGLPTTVFVDRDGIVRKIRVGELSRAVIASEVRALLR